MSVRDIADDRQPESRPWERSGLVGAVEAVEYVRKVLRIETGSAVANGQDSVLQLHVDVPAIRAPLDGVVEQVHDCAVDLLRRAPHEGRFDLGVEADARRPPARPGQRAFYDLVEGHVVCGDPQRGAAGKLDYVADQSGQRVELFDDVRAQLFPLSFR